MDKEHVRTGEPKEGDADDKEVKSAAELAKDEPSVQYTPFGETKTLTLKWSHVEKWIQVRTKSGKSASKGDIIKFMRMCELNGLNPWTGDAFLVGYDSQEGPTFSLITAYQALAKRAEANPHFDGIKAGVIVLDKQGELQHRDGAFSLDDDKLVGAWCNVVRKDRKASFSVSIKRSAYDSGRSRWKKDPEGMLVKCAKAAALREAFPSTAGALYITEEVDAMEAGNVGHVQIPTGDTPATADDVDAKLGAAEAPKAEKPKTRKQKPESKKTEKPQLADGEVPHPRDDTVPKEEVIVETFQGADSKKEIEGRRKTLLDDFPSIREMINAYADARLSELDAIAKEGESKQSELELKP